MDQNQKGLPFLIGEMIVATTGEHADYSVENIFVVLEDFDARPLAQEYENLGQSVSGCYAYDGFIEWLASKGLIKLVRYKEVSLGSYGVFADDFKVSVTTGK